MGTAALSRGAVRLACPPRVLARRLFVSKVRPALTAKDMFDFLASSDIRASLIEQIKPRVDHYSSFCVHVHPDDFAAVSSPDLWEESIVFREFLGSVRHPIDRYEHTLADQDKVSATDQGPTTE
ncbi:uncharacterized protein LOC108863809, partial [Galendromus occidentalis]|uniref:Uncharacterized protein LOC108863809 n=1 Tax=Galendromus occidentalis TaxID=34638 RepID=A0AAJ7L4Q3_9ACAR